MDAAHTNLKKIALFLATALLLAAPISAQTLSVDNQTINLGSASCNNFQFVNLSETGGSVTFTYAVQYPNGQGHGEWLYATTAGTSPNGGTSTNASTIKTNVVGTAGLSLKIGINSTFTSADTAQVILTPTGGGQSPITITVNFTPNSTCSGTGSTNNGSVSVTPGTLTMTAAQGNAQTLAVTVQNLTAAPLTFYTSTPTADGWLAATSGALTNLPGNGAVTVYATATTGNLGTGNLQSAVTFTTSAGTPLTVTVTFAITAGSGSSSGTLTVNGGTTTTVTMSSTGASIPGITCVNIADSNASVNSYGDSFITSTGGSWLKVNGSTFSPQTNQSFGANCLNVEGTNVVQSLASGVYTGTIFVTASDGSTATVTVNLLVSSGAASGITVQPGLIYTFPSVAAGTTATQLQQFTITANAGITLIAATVASPPGWFSMTNLTNTGGSETFTVTANPTGLASGLYSTNITVGSTSGTTTILVVLPVGQGSGVGTPTTSVVVPTALYFANQISSSYWTGGGATQSITITGGVGTQWSSSATYATAGQSWLRFGSSGGTFDGNPATLLVDIQPSGVPASGTPYTATINIVTPSGTIPVTVSLFVSSSGVLVASPASVVFTSNNGSIPAAANVNLGATDLPYPPAAGSTPVIQVNTSTSWLTVGVTGNRITLSASPANLATGAYAGAVTITSSTYPNSPMTYPVVFVVNGGTTTAGTLTLSTSALTFNALPGGSLPASQTLTVTAANATSVTSATTEQTCTNVNWLTITPSGAFTASTTAVNIAVSVNQGTFTANTTCSGTITLTTSAGQQNVGVTMIVAPAGTSGNVTVTPSTGLTFLFTLGQSNPAAQTLHIVNATSGTAQTPFQVTVAVSSGAAGWLSTNVSAATTPYDLSVSVNPQNLNAGSTYQGTVTISPTGGTAVPMAVTFTVNGSPVVSATPTTLSFNYSIGGSNPSPATVSVSGGGAQAAFTATASSAGGWLKVTPTSDTTPNTGTRNLTVTADPTGLNAGITYSGTVTVAGTGTATGSTVINVTFTVTAPLPTITKVTNGASFATGAVAPGEIISIFADITHPIGPIQSVSLTQDQIVNGKLPTTMGGVQVVFLPNGINAPLTYVSSTQINCVVPYEVAGVVNLQIEVKYLGQASNAFVVQTAASAPGIFSGNNMGTGPAAANQYDGLTGAYLGFNSVGNPAQQANQTYPGTIVVFYVTGEGSTNAGFVTGRVTPTTSPYTLPLLAPTVLIDGQDRKSVV